MGSLQIGTFSSSRTAADARQETIASIDVGLSKRKHGGSKNLDFYSPKSVIGSQDEAFGLTEDQLAEASALAGPDTKTGIRGLLPPRKPLTDS